MAARVQSLVRACELLKAFPETSEAMSLGELAHRAGLSKPTACRLLKTLADQGMVRQTETGVYRLLVRFGVGRRKRIGYALQSREFGFSRAIASGLQAAAAAAQVDLVLLDNGDDRRTALRNADILIRDRVDLVIESHTDARITSLLSRKFAAAGLPVIAVEIPIPQSVYYGANNTQAGLIAGRHLARWATVHWNGDFDEVLLLELPKAGQVPNARILGSLLGVIEQFTTVASRQVRTLRTDGHAAAAHERVRNYLRKTSAKRILVSAINDPSALGALQAFREAGRERDCAIVGQNASEEVHKELRSKRSRLIGSVAYFPERYGEGLIPLALEMIAGRKVPPATFVRHQLITATNIATYYPSGTAA